MYSFGELSWKQSQASEPVLESALGGQRVLAVAAGSFHSGAVTEDGGVHMWGDNGAGQCGLLGLSTVTNPTPVALVDSDAGAAQTVPVLELACGQKHTLALSAQREAWAWGSGCQLGLGVSVFPVWKPQKVELLAGRCVLQVACGASHSLALVRCPGPRDVRPPVDKCSHCNQLLYTMTDKEDHVIISDGHCCPLGVEPTEEEGKLETPAPVSLKTSPSEPVLPSQVASTSNALVCTASSDSTSDPSRTQDSEQRRTSVADGAPPAPEPGPSTQSRASGAKSSPYPDEQAVKEYLRKLSDCTQAEAKTGALHALLVRHPSRTS